MGNDIPRAAVIPPQITSNVGYPVVINLTGPLPTPTRGFPTRGVLPSVGLSNMYADKRITHIFTSLILCSILQDRDILSEIPTGRIIGMCVTKSHALLLNLLL